jgi:hypothetical protein
MNWDQIQGNWKQVPRQVQQQWEKHDDLDLVEGRRVELSARSRSATASPGTRPRSRSKLDAQRLTTHHSAAVRRVEAAALQTARPTT